MSVGQRRQVHSDFMHDNLTVVVATVAFGMGELGGRVVVVAAAATAAGQVKLPTLYSDAICLANAKSNRFLAQRPAVCWPATQMHVPRHGAVTAHSAPALPGPAGIDKGNVRHVYHYGAPASLEAYYQQVRPALAAAVELQWRCRKVAGLFQHALQPALHQAWNWLAAQPL